MGNSCCSEPREGKDLIDVKDLGKVKHEEVEMTPEELEKSIEEKRAIVEKLKVQLQNEWDNTDAMKNKKDEEAKELDSNEKEKKEVPKIAELDTDNDTDRSPRRSPSPRKEK